MAMYALLPRGGQRAARAGCSLGSEPDRGMGENLRRMASLLEPLALGSRTARNRVVFGEPDLDALTAALA